MSRAVCRNCWTWYSKGETVCPNCHVPLTAATAGTQASPVDSPVPVPTGPLATRPPQPGPPGISGLSWLLIGGGALAVIVVIALVIVGLLVTGTLGPVTSTDGLFSVTVPKGWVQSSAPTVSGIKPVLAIASLKKTNGVESHFIVADVGQHLPLSQLEIAWQPLMESGKLPIAGNLGSLTHTTVAGARALKADYQGSKFGGQLLFVDYGSKTYIIEMTSDPAEFADLRDGDFAAMLSSWQWR